MTPETEMGGTAGDFPPTRWTLVAAARAGPDARRLALEELLARYWKPLYFLARRKGRRIEQAKDDVQGFVAQLLDREFLERLDPGKGSLRGFLKASFQNFLASGHEAAAALKRGAGRAPLPLDFEVAERQISTTSAADPFEREWAVGVMERVMDQLGREFRPIELVRRAFGFGEPPSMADAAREHGMSVPQAKAFLHRARLRFRELVRAEVAETTGPEDVGAEIDRLLEALRP